MAEMSDKTAEHLDRIAIAISYSVGGHRERADASLSALRASIEEMNAPLTVTIDAVRGEDAREHCAALADEYIADGKPPQKVNWMYAKAISARIEAAELNQLFDLRHAADMRAIERWRAAGSDRDLRQPDHADLCVWLMEQVAEMERQRRIADAQYTCLRAQTDTCVAIMEQQGKRIEALIVERNKWKTAYGGWTKEITALEKERDQARVRMEAAERECILISTEMLSVLCRANTTLCELHSLEEPDGHDFVLDDGWRDAVAQRSEEIIALYERLCAAMGSPSNPPSSGEAEANRELDDTGTQDDQIDPAVVAVMRSYIERSGLSPDEFARQYNQITPEQIRRRYGLALPTPPTLTEDAQRSKDLPVKELPSTPENGSTDPRPRWLIYYEDSDVAPEVFTDEQAARERFASRLASWGCQLFRQIEHGLALTEPTTVAEECSSTEVCECCDAPATKKDVEGVPLCDDCYEDLKRETSAILSPDAGGGEQEPQ